MTKIPVDQAKCRNCGMLKNTLNTFPLHNNLTFTWSSVSKCCDNPDYIWYKEKKPGKRGRWIQKFV